MDLKEIMSIAGKPGLYRNIAQSKTGVIVESMVDGKRFQAFGNDKISTLGEISIYTETEDMPLREVFRLMQEKTATVVVPGPKASDKEIVSFFESVIPAYDKERFYVSHMRKILSWYNLLINNNITDFSLPEEEQVGQDSPGGDEESKETQ